MVLRCSSKTFNIVFISFSDSKSTTMSSTNRIHCTQMHLPYYHIQCLFFYFLRHRFDEWAKKLRGQPCLTSLLFLVYFEFSSKSIIVLWFFFFAGICGGKNKSNWPHLREIKVNKSKLYNNIVHTVSDSSPRCIITD